MGNILQQNRVSKEEFDLALHGCFPPGSLDDNEIYTERRRLPHDMQELGSYATDRQVLVIRVDFMSNGSAEIPLMDSEANRTVTVSQDGHILSDENGDIGFEVQGYLLGATTLEEHEEQLGR